MSCNTYYWVFCALALAQWAIVVFLASQALGIIVLIRLVLPDILCSHGFRLVSSICYLCCNWVEKCCLCVFGLSSWFFRRCHLPWYVAILVVWFCMYLEVLAFWNIDITIFTGDTGEVSCSRHCYLGWCSLFPPFPLVHAIAYQPLVSQIGEVILICQLPSSATVSLLLLHCWFAWVWLKKVFVALDIVATVQSHLGCCFQH